MFSLEMAGMALGVTLCDLPFLYQCLFYFYFCHLLRVLPDIGNKL